MPCSGLVAIVIPAYNAERHVAAAIRSALDQTYSDIEVVVVDDGSSDETGSVASSSGDERVRVLRQKNAGVGAARSRGLEVTTASWVGFLDADDRWYPTKVERQLAAFAADPSLQAVGCLMEYVSELGRSLGVAGIRIGPDEQRLVAAGGLNPFPPSAPLFRREAVVAAGGYDETLAAHFPGLVEDLDLLSKVARDGPITCLPVILGSYQIHDASASAAHYLSQREGIRYVTALRSSEATGETLTPEEFRARHRRTPWQFRGDLGAYCYRRAGLSVAGRTWVPAALYGAGAVALAPGYAVRKLIRQKPWSGKRRRPPGATT